MKNGRVGVIVVRAKGQNLLKHSQNQALEIVAVHLAGLVYFALSVIDRHGKCMMLDPREPILGYFYLRKDINKYQPHRYEDPFPIDLLTVVGRELDLDFVRPGAHPWFFIRKLASGEEFHQATGQVIRDALSDSEWQANRGYLRARYLGTTVRYWRKREQDDPDMLFSSECKVEPISQEFSQKFLS
jgi:hypothetical protein